MQAGREEQTEGGETGSLCAQTRLDTAEEYYGPAILLHLLRYGQQKKTALLRGISKSSCMSKRMDLLEKRGLICVTVDRFEKNTKWVDLTEKGRAVAELISEINDLLTGADVKEP
ncbi:MAG: hypothetical protein FWC29_06050 [Methanomassiliicoccaceae archaeon]|nr:hypothetical protein [Methanomassiliicoccaceae archaeon]